MHKNDFYISKLIAAYLSETIDEKALKELNDWREESAQNELLFQQICNTNVLENRSTQAPAFNKAKGIEMILSRTAAQRRKQIFRHFMKYASLGLIPLLIVSLLIMLHNNPASTPLLTGMQETTRDILPGESKAILTFENGEQIELVSNTEQTIEDKDGTIINIDKAGLKYNTDTKAASGNKEFFNKLDIPRGGEYVLVLSDQSKVRLNAMSSLRFPVQFKNDKRIVELEGEAYFDVAPDNKPFIVRIKGVDIEVLGTSFNISAYTGENAQTTLVSGTIKLIPENSKHSRTLHPSEQATYNYSSKEIEVNKVDVSLYTSWINGKIYFKDQRLEDIMKSLSRWYDIEVLYENVQAKDIRFGCNLDRYQEIAPFIDLLEQTGKVKIKTQDKKIIIN